MLLIIIGVHIPRSLWGIKMKKILNILFLTFTTLLSSCSTSNQYFNSNQNVVISVEQSDCYTVVSKNPQEVKRGSDVRFKLDFDECYGFKSANSGFYLNNYLIIEDVQYSETIHIECFNAVKVTLDIYDGCHYTVKSENPLVVEKGKDAIFDIEFENGYVFESSSDGVFENGKFIVKNVEKNKTVSLLAKLKGNVHISIVHERSFGYIYINTVQSSDDYGSYGETMTVEAVPTSETQFVCWSIGDYISNAMPYSFERVLNYQLEQDVTLYANFWNKDKNSIIYNGSGGETLCGDKVIYYPHTIANHIRVNTIQGSKAFFRSGYQLESWNTKEDGTGERIGLGSRIKIEDENKPLNLYAQWIKETPVEDFVFSLNSDSTYSLISCISQSETIVIPERYNDCFVTRIYSEAFKQLPFKTLYFPQYLIEVESNSIIECNQFDNLHFFDYLNSIPDDFYVGHKPSHLFINANTDPKYIGSYQSAFARKTDLLSQCDDEKIIFIGNSNTFYSIDGSLIYNKFGKDVLCYGVQSGIGVAWELACLKALCKDNYNIVVFCIEFGGNTIGYFTEHKYYGAEANYDLLSYIDFNELSYKNVFNAYTRFKEMKKFAPVTPYSKNDYGCDSYGCTKLNIDPYRDEGWFASEINIDLDEYKKGSFNWIENFCSSFTNSTFLISTCSFNMNAIPANKRNVFYSDYEQSIKNYTKYTLISSLRDYAFSGNAFHDDNYHLIYSYAIERTNRLIADLEKVI